MVCGDGEYIIYTAMALRNKSFGSAQEFVWAADSSEYGIRENSKVKLFKNFKEKKSFKPDYGAESKEIYVKCIFCKVCETWCNRSFWRVDIESVINPLMHCVPKSSGTL